MPKPIPKHKHSSKSTLKHKHKCRNPYWNRNTNAEMGQRWRLGAWGLGRRWIEEERWLELGRGETYPDWIVRRNHKGAAWTRVTRRWREARQSLWTAWILSLRRTWFSSPLSIGFCTFGFFYVCIWKSREWHVLILLVFWRVTNWSIDLAVVNSLRSKLANKKVEGVFWPVVESLGGVWAFFPKVYYTLFCALVDHKSFQTYSIFFVTIWAFLPLFRLILPLITWVSWIGNDDAEKRITNKSHGPHVLETISAQHKKRRPNREHRCGVGQIPSESQVRTSHNSRVPELEWIMCTLFFKGLWVFIAV